MSMELSPNAENLDEAFGFCAPRSFERILNHALEARPNEPYLAFKDLGLVLGGLLFPFLGGSPISMREPEFPPEFFPFASLRGAEKGVIGLVVDDPSRTDGSELPIAVLAREAHKDAGIVAESLGELLGWLSQQSESTVECGIEVSIPDRKTLREKRRASANYWTIDEIGVIVPEEPSPLSLVHPELRGILIEQRDIDKARQAGKTALKIGAPGAALALARELNWWLGDRDHWFQLALELYEEAYTMLERPLLTRVARREWARHHGRRR